MPSYSYTASAADGKTKKGTAVAQDEHELAENLKNDGLILIGAVLQSGKEKGKIASWMPSFKVSTKDKLMVTRNLKIMVSTGLPLVRSFGLLATQARSKKLKNALNDIKDEISGGETLSNALARYPDIFSDLFRSMIAVGEASGTMENVLEILSLQLEKEHELSSKIHRALIYPAILLVVMTVVGGIVMVVFVPHLKTLFSGVGVQLPIYTQIFISMGEILSNYWYFLILILALLIPITLKLLKTKKGKFLMDTFLIKLPFFSSLVKESNAAAMIRSLSSLISSGVALVKSLEITAGTVSNFYFKKAINEAAEKIKTGEKLFVALTPYKDIFPFGTIETIEIGEETGETSQILKKLAEFYEDEVSNATDNLSVLIEPVLIVILGIAVGIFAFSLISPLYSVLGNIS